MKIVVYHSSYGCDTGCCGHTVEIVEGRAPDSGRSETFYFDHPYPEEHRVFAEQMVREAFGDEHVADLDWENCHIVDLDGC